MKINLGSGHWKLEGWINVDIDPDSGPDVLADLSQPLPFDDDSADFMNTEDFIDQLTLGNAMVFMKECRRILKPGGVIRVLTPDLEKLTRMYLESPKELVELWLRTIPVPLQLRTAGEVLNLGMRFAGHTYLYDAENMHALCAACGFEARQVEYNQSEYPELRGLDLRSPDEALSMYFECTKLPG